MAAGLARRGPNAVFGKAFRPMVLTSPQGQPVGWIDSIRKSL
jgi:hypothetical protein